MSVNQCTALILAGGQSSRMGSDKALLKHCDGKSNLEHCIDLLVDSGCKKIVVGGDYEEFLQALYANKTSSNNGLQIKSDTDLFVIPDRIPGLGPLAGIETVIHKLQPEKLLILPVDMPKLTPRLIKRLISAVDKHPYVHFKEYILPLCFVVDKTLKKHIHQVFKLKEHKQHSIKNLLKQLPVKKLSISPNLIHLLENFNNPEQWQLFLNSQQEENSNVS